MTIAGLSFRPVPMNRDEIVQSLVRASIYCAEGPLPAPPRKRILSMAAKQGSSFLFFMSNRTRRRTVGASQEALVDKDLRHSALASGALQCILDGIAVGQLVQLDHLGVAAEGVEDLLDLGEATAGESARLGHGRRAQRRIGR
jgi:hypothetical protein